MIEFNINQDPSTDGFFESYKDEPWGKESVYMFQEIKKIIELGKFRSKLEELREAERKLRKYANAHGFKFFLGYEPKVWDIKTGKYLFRIEIPEQEPEELRTELIKWKKS